MASKRRKRRRQCNGKHCYTSLGEACRDARLLAREDDKAVEAYRCDNCGCVHVGHPPRDGSGAPNLCRHPGV